MTNRISKFFFSFLAVVTAIFPVYVYATTITDGFDQPSSTQISAASNHKFTLTLANNSGGLAGTIQLTFPTGFDLTTLNEDDIDIADDGIDIVTYQTTCLSVDAMLVAISGQTITFSDCDIEPVRIGAGSVVTIEIGTNASSSGLGTHRITNPSTAASWFVNVSGTSGNSGSIILATTTAGAASVSATVAAAVPPNDGGGGADTCSSSAGSSCTSSANSCGMTDTGTIGCTGGCSASTPSDSLCSVCAATQGNSCASSANSCGITNSGTVTCDGSCDAIQPDDALCPVACSTHEGESCVSSANSCGITNSGTIGCDGGCSADSPSESACTTAPTCAANSGFGCTSSANSCGMTNSGTVSCDGACSANRPSDSACSASSCSSNEGDICTSGSNSCGMSNSGVISCSGICSASSPSEDLCAPSEACVLDQGQDCTTPTNICGMFNSGTISCSGTCSADAPQDSLCAIPEVIPPVVPPTVPPGASIPPVKTVETPVAIPKQTVSLANIASSIEIIRALPEVHAAVTVAIPVATIAVAATTAVLVSSFNLLTYLQFLFTSPLMLFARRKRKAFGIVYNSVTKMAVDLATVRLYDAVTNRLVRSAVTDSLGKYFFIANPGQYRITVTKGAFTFPSTYLAGVKDDGVYLDVYSGQTIVVSEKDATIAANIPLDHFEDAAQHTGKGMIRHRLLRRMQFVFSISGIFLSAGIWFFSPSALTAILAVGQIGIFALCLRLAKAKRPRGWGIVFDSTSRRPVGNAIVRLFEPKYNKLVESTLTDTLGRYSFLVGPNEYFVRTDKPGYDEHIVRPIDYRQKTEPSAIAIDVPLVPAKPV